MQASAVKQARTILRSTALSAGYGGGLVCTQLVMIAGAHIFRAALSLVAVPRNVASALMRDLPAPSPARTRAECAK
jgi:hypothetical protein